VMFDSILSIDQPLSQEESMDGLYLSNHLVLELSSLDRGRYRSIRGSHFQSLEFQLLVPLLTSPGTRALVARPY
jgi:hypothetical protein